MSQPDTYEYIFEPIIDPEDGEPITIAELAQILKNLVPVVAVHESKLNDLPARLHRHLKRRKIPRGYRPTQNDSS